MYARFLFIVGCVRRGRHFLHRRSALRKTLVAVLVVAVTTNAVVVFAPDGRDGVAPVSISQPKAEAQVLPPLPPEGFLFNYIYYLFGNVIIPGLQWVFIVYAVWQVIDWFSNAVAGRPTIGRDSATDCDALFYIASSNCIVRAFGYFIKLMERQGWPISSSNTVIRGMYTTAAWKMCYEFEAMFGTTVGDEICQQYVNIGALNNPCSNATAWYYRSLLDNEVQSLITSKNLNIHLYCP